MWGMAIQRPLQGKRVAVLAADGFEMVELVAPIMALRAAGAATEVISLRSGRIRGVNLHEPALRVRVAKTLTEADPADFDALLIPGGFINPDLLRQSAAARDFVRAFDREGKPIATLCHGPWLLASADLVEGRTMTSWPGIRDDLVNAGATWLDREVVRNGNWVSSRGPQDMSAFLKAMIELFASPLVAMEPVAPTESSPRRDDPPRTVLQVMRWLPRPSVRAVAALAVLGLWALHRSRRGGLLPRF
jgi:protease I